MTKTHDEYQVEVCIREIPERLVEGKKLIGKEGRCQICGKVDTLYKMNVSIERTVLTPIERDVMEVNIPFIQNYGAFALKPKTPIIITELP